MSEVSRCGKCGKLLFWSPTNYGASLGDYCTCVLTDYSHAAALAEREERIRQLEVERVQLRDCIWQCLDDMDILRAEVERLREYPFEPGTAQRLQADLTKVSNKSVELFVENTALRARLAKLEEAKAELGRLGDNAYCESLRVASQPECLGWEAKVRSGQYGASEHKAHALSDELMGKHRAFCEALRIMSAALEGGERK